MSYYAVEPIAKSASAWFLVTAGASGKYVGAAGPCLANDFRPRAASVPTGAES